MNISQVEIDKFVREVSDKRIVLLGESAHGIREQNLNRFEIIKWLHKELGFNQLYLESVKPSKKLNSYTSGIEFIKNELHEVYHTKEVLSLINYVIKSDMEFVGFEIYGKYLDEYSEIKKNSINNGYDSRTYRDLKMFEIFKNVFDIEKDKAIIWGHNGHMSKKASPGAYREKVFGEYVFEYFGGFSYSVGQYIGAGVIDHMKDQERVVNPLPNTIEEYISNNVESTLFLTDLSDDVFTKQIGHSFCGGELESLVLKSHFDALVLNPVGSKPERLIC